MKMESESKSIKIPGRAYEELMSAKQNAIKQAHKEKKNELEQALLAMGIGAFAGWLIFKAIQQIKV